MEPPPPEVADAVASAMKDWAMEKGATHYAHVFYPLTGLTAEKHDSFLEPSGDGSAIAEETLAKVAEEARALIGRGVTPGRLAAATRAVAAPVLAPNKPRGRPRT